MGVAPNSLRRHGERNALPDLSDFQFTFDFHDAIEPDVGCRATRSRYCSSILTLQRADTIYESSVSGL